MAFSCAVFSGKRNLRNSMEEQKFLDKTVKTKNEMGGYSKGYLPFLCKSSQFSNKIDI